MLCFFVLIHVVQCLFVPFCDAFMLFYTILWYIVVTFVIYNVFFVSFNFGVFVIYVGYIVLFCNDTYCLRCFISFYDKFL